MVFKSYIPILLLFCFSAVSAPYNTGYVSLDIPENWKCKVFGTDHVCHSTLSKKQKEAMIILTAKKAGVFDTFSEFQSFLSKPRQINKTGAASTIPISPKKIFIKKHPWVEGMHLGSEVPNYFTRYVVTVFGNSQTQLSVLVTLSAHKNHYKKYSKDFLKTIYSLQLTNDVDAISSLFKGRGQNESMGNIAAYMGHLIDEEMDTEATDGGEKILGLDFNQWLIALGALAVILIILAVRKRRRKKKSKKSKK